MASLIARGEIQIRFSRKMVLALQLKKKSIERAEAAKDSFRLFNNYSFDFNYL